MFLVQLHFNWYLTAIYLLMKVLNVVALAGQLVIMNYFVADNDFLWGINVLAELWKGGDWRTTGVFPRVSNYFIVIYWYYVDSHSLRLSLHLQLQ